MDLIQIGIRLKTARKHKNLTQEQLAEMIEVSPHYIYEIERGLKAMSLYTLDNIVERLNVSVDYLLYGNKLPYVNSNQDDFDSLTMLVSELSPKKRKEIAEIISVILPYLK